MSPERLKAVGLLSGGLDSCLALRLVRDQGVEIAALNFATAFCCCTPKDRSCRAARTAVRQLGINLKVVNVTREFLKIVERPKHGYGRGMNPCIDCRVLMLRKAGEYMREIGASFVITGEVLGQRPMSQRRPVMRLIERESGLDGLIVRPLCATLVEPSLPEERGWVDRQKFRSFSGRSRRPQIALAEELGVRDYPCPAGGCLLTDPVFAAKVRDLLEHEGSLTVDDVRLLKVGRHFRLGPRARAVVGRNQAENRSILAMALDGDALLEITPGPGPTTLVRGHAETGDLLLASGITARYGKGRGPEVRVAMRRPASRAVAEFAVAPLRDTDIDRLRIAPALRRARRRERVAARGGKSWGNGVTGAGASATGRER